MSYISLQNRVKHSTPTTFFFAEKIDFLSMKVFTSEILILNKENIGEGSHTVTVPER